MPESHYQKLIIRKIVAETKLTKTFYMSNEDGTIPAYKPGQYLTLAFDTVAGEERRSYSISSVDPAVLTITVKRVPNGAFSRQFIEHFKVGDTLWLTGIAGLFLLPEHPERYRQMFFMAAGSGIVPVFSLLRELLFNYPETDVVLIYSNKSREDTIYYDRICALKEQYGDRFMVDFLYSDSKNLLRARLNGFLLIEMLGRYKRHDYSQTFFFICGPFEYMDFIHIVLLTEGVPAEHIRHENFNSFKVEKLDEPDDKDPHDVYIRFKEEEKKINVRFPESILTTALKNGLHLPYSCRSGQCGSCVAHCTSGKVWMAYNEVLTDADLKKGLVLTCMGYPVDGDVHLDYER